MTFPDRGDTSSELSDGNYEKWIITEEKLLHHLTDKIVAKNGRLEPGFISQHTEFRNADDPYSLEILFVAQDLQPAARIYLFLQPNFLKQYSHQFAITAYVNSEYRRQGILKNSLELCHKAIEQMITNDGSTKPAVVAAQVGIPNTSAYSNLRNRVINLHLKMGYEVANLGKGQLTKEIYPVSSKGSDVPSGVLRAGIR